MAIELRCDVVHHGNGARACFDRFVAFAIRSRDGPLLKDAVAALVVVIVRIGQVVGQGLHRSIDGHLDVGVAIGDTVVGDVDRQVHMATGIAVEDHVVWAYDEKLRCIVVGDGI